MKGKILKKVIAAALVLTLVSGGMPISPVSDMFGGAVITANAANPVFSGEGTEQSPFLIQSSLDWQNFAGYVNTENSTYGDKYYKLTADIEVTGSDSSSLPFIVGGVSSCAFRGHFDGDGHTLTYNYSGRMEGAAPFRYVGGATIENLTTAGTVSVAGNTYGAGIAGYITGDTTINNCTSNVTIKGSGSVVGQFGGFVGRVSSGVTLNINECTWGGSMTGSVTMTCGGFVGYNLGTVNITDCLCSPASITIGDGKVYAFVQNWTGGSYSLNNAYRTRDFAYSDNNQGKRVYSLTDPPSDKVCKAIQIFNGYRYWQSGTAVITGIEASYPLAGKSMALPSCGLTFDGETVESDCYTVSVKDSSGQTVNNITKADTYTLTVTGFLNYFGSISKTFKVYSVDSIPYIDASGNEQEADSATQLASATLPEGDWWYVTGETTIDSRISISGTKHLILTDGAVLNIPKGIQLTSGNTLNIYGQSENTGKLVINGVESENAGIGGNHWQSCGALTVNGGDITVTGGEDGAGIGGGGYSSDAGDTITINGGKVTAKGGSARTVGIGGGGVYYPGQTGGNGGTIIINGGIVSARGNENGAGMGGGINCSDKGTITINWKNASDRIYASSYNSTVTVNGNFVHEGTNTKATSDNIGGKTLVPAKTVTVGEVNGGTVVLNGADSGSLFGIGSTVTLTVTPDRGYVVTSVKYNSNEIEPEGGVYSFVMPAENVTVSAEFENRYMITWIDGNDNTLKTDLVEYGTTPTYDGETPTKTDDTKYSYTFIGWSPEITSVTGDQTYTAQFSKTPKSYNVTYKVDGEVYGEIDTVAYGTTLTARAIPEARTGYTFSGWGEIPETMPDHDVVIEGTFTQNDYNITISDNIANGSVSAKIGDTPAATAHYNDTVTLTVTPETGYMFKSVSVNNGAVDVIKYGSGEGIYTFTMPDGDVTVSAEFEQIIYTLVSAKAATCTEDGNIEYYQGSDGKVYLLTDGTYTETTLAAVTIEKKGHRYVVDHSDWTEVNDHYYVQVYGKCSVCGDEVSLGVTNVDFTDGVVTKAATETEEGIMTYTAKVSYYYNDYTATKEVAIPKIGTVAKIGDTEYNSLKDAIREAEDIDVITLYADVNEPDLYLGTYYKNITLDLNNHSVTLGTIVIYGSLTIKNGTLTCHIDNGNGGNDNTLMLDNSVLNTGDSGIQWMAKHIAVKNGSTMNISGSAFLGYGGEEDFDLTIDETSKVVLNNTVPDGYNSDLVRSEFSNYLPDGYSFSYDDNEYVYKIVNDDGVIVTTPVILTYRSYHRITLNFDSWYGMVTADKSSALVDDTITLTVNPDEHYQVKSVTVNGGVVAVTSNNDGTYSFTMPDGDVTVSAEFEAITYSVAFNKNSNDATGSMDNQSFTGGTAQNLTANGFTAPTGYHFAGWATSANGAVEYADGAEVSNLTAVNNDTVTLYAKWEANKHTVTYKVDGEVYGAVDTVAYGTALTAREAPTKTGYTFSGWSEIPETMPDHDIEITGTFSVDENYGKLNVADYKSGDTWTAPTQEGKVFAGWFADSEYTTPYMETTGYAYAKFIDESCITVKWQKRLDNPDPNKTDIRLVSTLDCGDYDSLHFVLTFTDNGFVIKDGQITRLYDSLDGFVNGENVSYTPDIFCEDSKYFAAYTVTGMPNSLYDTSLTAQVYIITLDGTRVDGTPLTFKVADDQSNN